jgi:poly-gamma-glutamate capsule biosynthesis protein CapA/YwtB (metallophosphatase superfamily)
VTASTDLTITAVGDVFLDRAEPETAFHLVRDVFTQADVAFANLEGGYADEWERAPSAGVPLVASPRFVDHVAASRLNVVSLANNHSVDGGYRTLLGTRRMLQDRGLATAGAGEHEADAHEPAVLSTERGTVAVLAYAAVFPHGYEARPGWPGLAPLRGYTQYTPWEENEWNPGLVPRVTTTPHQGDLAALTTDVAAARQRADVVLVSVHWGDFTRPFVLTDHERQMARAAVDAGADAVLGHHHHLLRGVEFYRGRPIFYGLGHFVFDLPDFERRLTRDAYLGRGDAATVRAGKRRFGDHRIGPREGYPLLPFHPDARLTGIAVLRHDGTALRPGFVPCVIGPDNRPRPATDRAEFASVVDYLRRCCAAEDLPTELVEDKTETGLPMLRIEPAA